ncbi:MMPL [Parelaphostrongylus tenuis]|uniref:MMPL n=1 Tax=Parelaphostrongylus tenuis TaxID=148309 RepID=A0AAD5M7P8_PARTN|nr:MMPL [Parelaphostrongylus tenuis]
MALQEQRIYLVNPAAFLISDRVTFALHLDLLSITWERATSPRGWLKMILKRTRLQTVQIAMYASSSKRDSRIDNDAGSPAVLEIARRIALAAFYDTLKGEEVLEQHLHNTPNEQRSLCMPYVWKRTVYKRLESAQEVFYFERNLRAWNTYAFFCYGNVKGFFKKQAGPSSSMIWLRDYIDYYYNGDPSSIISVLLRRDNVNPYLTGVLTLACTTVVCSLFIPNPCSVITAGILIASISLGVIGFLSIWNFDVDPVVMATLLMSIGMSVDFNAHVAYQCQLTVRKEVRDGCVSKIPVRGPQQ